jgi:hypothetical protein
VTPVDHKRIPVDAVHEDDAAATLKALGIERVLAAGDLKCSICGQPLTPELLGAVRDRGRLDFACTRLDCVRMLSGERE